MQTLDELICELLNTYDDGGGQRGPGLISRLDAVELRTGQPSGGLERRAPPGSRPPASLEALHWSQKIKTEAVELDQWLRGSPYAQPWDKAMRALPAGAESAGAYSQTVHSAGIWHSTALTVLGLQRPAMDMPHVRCLACAQRTIRCRADRAQPRAWCTNPDCADDDGHPARYTGNRLYLLTRHRDP